MTEFYPPQDIIDLFETEELAQEKGREAFIEWYKSLNTKLGDRFFLPEVNGGEWWEQGARTQ